MIETASERYFWRYQGNLGRNKHLQFKISIALCNSFIAYPSTSMASSLFFFIIAAMAWRPAYVVPIGEYGSSCVEADHVQKHWPRNLEGTGATCKKHHQVRQGIYVINLTPIGSIHL
jgi:hypothetical protein